MVLDSVVGSTFQELTDVYETYSEGDPEGVEELHRFAQELIPEMEVLSVKGGSCVTSSVSMVWVKSLFVVYTIAALFTIS